MNTLPPAEDRAGEADPSAGHNPLGNAGMRMDALAPAGMEGMHAAPAGPKVPSQVIFLLALLVISGGALYGMRRMGMGPIGAAADMPLEFDYPRKANGAEHQKLLSDLNTSRITSQVPPDDVQKNPFKLAEALKRTDTTLTPGPTAPKGPSDAERRAELIKSTLSGLRVHGILDGAVPVARINDQTVKIGDTVADVFVVKAIQGRSIELSADDKSYTISLDEQQTPGGRRPSPSPGRPQPPKRK